LYFEKIVRFVNSTSVAVGIASNFGLTPYPDLKNIEGLTKRLEEDVYNKMSSEKMFGKRKFEVWISNFKQIIKLRKLKM